jgi:osmotically-inducible protein OsmY
VLDYRVKNSWHMGVCSLSISGIIITSAAFCGGCSMNTDKPNEPQPAMRAMGQPVPSSTESGVAPTNESIGSEIRRQLSATPTSTAGIVVEVDDGTVTLRGRAPDLATSWRAEGIARAAKGVKTVVNQIVVITPTVPP